MAGPLSSVTMSQIVWEQLLAWAAATPDAEVCGLLIGDRGAVTYAILADNHAEKPATAFEIDPRTLITAHKAQRAGGPHIIGHFHSHPNGLAEPSATDAGMAEADGELWLIIANTTITAWQAAERGAHLGRFTQVNLRVHS